MKPRRPAPKRKTAVIRKKTIRVPKVMPQGAFVGGLPVGDYPFATLEHCRTVVIGIVHLGPAERVDLRLTGDILEALRFTETSNGVRSVTCEDVSIRWAAALWRRHSSSGAGVLPDDLWRSFNQIVEQAAARCEESD